MNHSFAAYRLSADERADLQATYDGLTEDQQQIYVALRTIGNQVTIQTSTGHLLEARKDFAYIRVRDMDTDWRNTDFKSPWDILCWIEEEGMTLASEVSK